MIILDSIEKVRNKIGDKEYLSECVLKDLTFRYDDDSISIFNDIYFNDCIFSNCLIKGKEETNWIGTGINIKVQGTLKLINCKIFGTSPSFLKKGSEFHDFFLYMRDTEINDTVVIRSSIMDFNIINCDIRGVQLYGRIHTPYTFRVINSEVRDIHLSGSLPNLREETLSFIRSNISEFELQGNCGFFYLDKESSLVKSLFGEERPSSVDLLNPAFNNCDLRGLSFNGIKISNSIVFSDSKVKGMDFSGIEFNGRGTSAISFENCDCNVEEEVGLPEGSEVYRSMLNGRIIYTVKVR